jgi:hypothetical protein
MRSKKRKEKSRMEEKENTVVFLLSMNGVGVCAAFDLRPWEEDLSGWY